jgi:hypothetical protein
VTPRRDRSRLRLTASGVHEPIRGPVAAREGAPINRSCFVHAPLTIGRRSHGAPHFVFPVRPSEIGASPPNALAEPVLVVTAQPELVLALLLATHRRAVEQPVVRHRWLEPARSGHVGSVDDAV